MSEKIPILIDGKVIGKCHRVKLSEEFSEGGTVYQYHVKGFEKPTLNENQQIVLKWLKERYQQPIIINPVAVIFSLHDGYIGNEHSEVSEAYGELTDKEESQVLQVFSQWAQEQED